MNKILEKWELKRLPSGHSKMASTNFRSYGQLKNFINREMCKNSRPLSAKKKKKLPQLLPCNELFKWFLECWKPHFQKNDYLSSNFFAGDFILTLLCPIWYWWSLMIDWFKLFKPNVICFSLVITGYFLLLLVTSGSPF